jgi:NADH-quinone oxidoreductase subunit C
MSNPKATPDDSAKQKTASKEKKPGGPVYTGYDQEFFLAVENLLQAVHVLDQEGFFLEDISCLDIQEGYLLAYRFNRFEHPGRVGLRVIADRDDPEVPSIWDIYPGAAWHERECFDFFGIRFCGHPNLIPLLLDPEHKGPPPLLKDESDRKALAEILPDRDTSPVSPQSPEFRQQILDCSIQDHRKQS